MEKLNTKEWFEKIVCEGKIIWGTNSFSDIAAVSLIDRYLDYLKGKENLKL